MYIFIKRRDGEGGHVWTLGSRMTKKTTFHKFTINRDLSIYHINLTNLYTLIYLYRKSSRSRVEHGVDREETRYSMCVWQPDKWFIHVQESYRNESMYKNPIRMNAHLSDLSIYLSVCLSVCLSMCLSSIYLQIDRSNLSVYYQSIYSGIVTGTKHVIGD